MFYVIGDRDGPLKDEVRIGYTSLGAYRSFKKNFALYRSRKILAHVEMILIGEAAARMIKAEIQLRLIEDWRKISERWWKVTDDEIKAIVGDVISSEGIRVLQQDEATEMLANKFSALMDRMARG